MAYTLAAFSPEINRISFLAQKTTQREISRSSVKV